MAEKTSLEDLLKGIYPSRETIKPCRDDDLIEIALSVTEWQSIAPFLGLTDAEEEELELDYAKNRTQKIGMLWKWKRKFGRKATYKKLVSVFWKLPQLDLVAKLCEALMTKSSDDVSANTRSSLALFAQYLRGRYTSELPSFFTLQWTPTPTRTVLKLAVIGHETIQRGPSDEELVRLALGVTLTAS